MVDEPLTTSSAWLERAKRLIPTGASTLSKRSRAYVEGSSPACFTKAEGAHFWDLEGRKFLDWNMALGPAALGYGYPTVVNAVCAAVRGGNLASVPSASEPGA